MTAEDFRRRAHEVVDWIADYYEGLPTREPVLSQVSPGSIMAQLPRECPEEGEAWDAVMSDLDAIIMPGVTHWQHPSFFGYFPATSSFPGMLGDMLSGALNVIGFNWLASPAATELEQSVLDWLAQLIGLPDAFLSRSGKGGGVIQGTASEAALVALLAARARITGAPPASPGAQADAGSPGDEWRLVAYASDQAHSCVRKACMVAGVRHFRAVHTRAEDHHCMRADDLAAAVKEDLERGLIPAFVCASLGTTSSAAVDDIAGLARVAQEHGMWLHVDAAYAGAAMVLPEMRHHMKGVELADSFDFNPHKWLLTNFDCSALFVRDAQPLVRALTLTPAFLQNGATESGLVVDYKDWQVPLGRRFRALKLWAVLRTYGARGLRDFIRSHVSLAREFESWVQADARFEVAAPVHFSLVCFRLVGAGDDANSQLLDRINATGKMYLTHTVLNGKYTLRMAIGGSATRREDVVAAWDCIRSQVPSS